MRSLVELFSIEKDKFGLRVLTKTIYKVKKDSSEKSCEDWQYIIRNKRLNKAQLQWST